MSLVNVERLRKIAEVEFADIVKEAFVPDINALRIILADGSFVDVWFSLKLSGRYSYHTFSVNFKIPDNWGIGKSVSRGFGTVKRSTILRAWVLTSGVF